MTKLFFKPSALLSFFFMLSFALIAMGHRAYFVSGGRVVPFFFLLFPVVFVFLVVFFFKKLSCVVRIELGVLLFFLAIYSFLSALIFDRYQDLSQLYVYFLIPICFSFFGFYVLPGRIAPVIVFFLIVSAFFSVAQVAYTGFGISGPAGFFAYIKENDYLIQEDVLKRTLALRATGILVEPNLLGFFSGLTFFWFLQTRYFLSPKVYMSGLYLSLFCVLASMSRGSIVALIFAMGLKFFFSLVRLRFSLSGVIGFVLALLMLLALVSLAEFEQFSRIGEILGVIDRGSGESANLDARYTAWDSLVGYVFDNPLGVVVPPQIVIDDSPDNQYLYFALQGGFLLFGVFVLFCLKTLLESFWLSVSERSDFLYCFIFFVVNNLSITAMNSFSTAVLWMAYGFYLAQRLSEKGRPARL